jgi:hypothetical protein
MSVQSEPPSCWFVRSEQLVAKLSRRPGFFDLRLAARPVKGGPGAASALPPRPAGREGPRGWLVDVCYRSDVQQYSLVQRHCPASRCAPGPVARRTQSLGEPHSVSGHPADVPACPMDKDPAPNNMESGIFAFSAASLAGPWAPVRPPAALQRPSSGHLQRCSAILRTGSQRRVGQEVRRPGPTGARFSGACTVGRWVGARVGRGGDAESGGSAQGAWGADVTNPAPLLRPDGRALLLYRGCPWGRLPFPLLSRARAWMPAPPTRSRLPPGAQGAKAPRRSCWPSRLPGGAGPSRKRERPSSPCEHRTAPKRRPPRRPARMLRVTGDRPGGSAVPLCAALEPFGGAKRRTSSRGAMREGTCTRCSTPWRRCTPQCGARAGAAPATRAAARTAPSGPTPSPATVSPGPSPKPSPTTPRTPFPNRYNASAPAPRRRTWSGTRGRPRRQRRERGARHRVAYCGGAAEALERRERWSHSVVRSCSTTTRYPTRPAARRCCAPAAERAAGVR